MPVLYLFFEQFCSNDPRLKVVATYLRLLCMILGTLASGPDEAPKHCDVLRRNMLSLHALHAQLSDDFKPKMHHMHHIIDGMEWLGTLLSCFVCGRKHRHVKDSALHVFRHLEHTVLHDVVHKQCHQLLEGVELFKEQFLVNACDVRDVANLRRSTRAVLKVGGLYAGDIVYIRGSRCGCVNMFYEFGDAIVVQVPVFQSVAGAPDAFDERLSEDSFVDASGIVDACTWFYASPAILKVAVPPLALL